jgi:hypothetical protein
MYMVALCEYLKHPPSSATIVTRSLTKINALEEIDQNESTTIKQRHKQCNSYRLNGYGKLMERVFVSLI